MRTSWLRRSAMFVALAAGALLVGPVPPISADADEPSVVIYQVATADGNPTESERVKVSLSEILAITPAKSGSFTVRGGTTVEYDRSVTLDKLKEVVAPDAFDGLKFLETDREGPHRQVISKDDYGSAAIFIQGDKIGFHPNIESDEPVDPADVFTTGSQLNLKVHTTGELLAVTLKVTDTEPNTKDRPRFTSELSPQPDEELQYEWDLGDGEPIKNGLDAISHRYKKKGTYTASLIVSGKEGSFGRSGPLTIKVDNPPKVVKPRKTPKPSATPTPTRTTGTGTGSTPLPPSNSWSGGYTPRYIPPSSDLPSREPWPTDAPDSIIDDGLTSVEGYVLAGAEIVPGGTPETIPGAGQVAHTASATDRFTPKNIATWSLVALGVVLLMGAGAASESRWLRQKLNTLRRRA